MSNFATRSQDGRPNQRRGIYCLANDNVLEWFLALAKSLRQHNPNIPLVVIPFDSNCAKLERLTSEYKFSLTSESLEDLDRVGRLFFPDGYSQSHCFRKFYMFWGVLDQFLFLDSDVVVLDDLAPLFCAYSQAEVDVLCTDVDVEQVYLKGPLHDRSSQDANFRAINTGTFMSRKGILAKTQVEDLAERGSTRDDLRSSVMEQPFLNFCLHETGTSIKEFHEVMPRMHSSAWAADADINLCDNIVQQFKEPHHKSGRWAPVIHWAGFPLNPHMPNRHIYLHYRLSGLSTVQRLVYHLSNNAVVYRALHLHYRNRGRVKRLASKIVDRLWCCS